MALSPRLRSVTVLNDLATFHLRHLAWQPPNGVDRLDLPFQCRKPWDRDERAARAEATEVPAEVPGAAEGLWLQF